ncbi:hypothetical protein YSY43_12080 [Paenibacillus sp. YSY-4.3]
MKKASVLWNQWIFTLLLTMTIIWTLPAAQAAASEATGTLEWERALGTNLKLLNLSETGNGYSVVGLNEVSNLVYLAKLHADGTVYWEEELPLIAGNGKRATLQTTSITSDGGYILGAEVPGFHFRYSDFYTAKVNSDGMFEWESDHSVGSHIYLEGIHQVKDGGFLYLVNAESLNSGSSRVVAGKLDADGKEMWRTTLASGGRYSSQYADRIIELEDGSSWVQGSKDGELYAWKLDADGNLISSPDGGLLPVGKAAAIAGGGYVLARMEDGSTSLNRYNAQDQLVSRHVTSIKGAAIALNTTPGGGFLFHTNQGVYETDSQGNIRWSYEISGLQRVVPTSDGGAAAFIGDKILKLNVGGSMVRRLEFDSSSYSLIEGQTLDTVLTAVYGSESNVVTKLDQVVFSSDDASIATVDPAGNITGHKLGSTYVRAALDGVEAVAKVYVFKVYTALQLDSKEYSVNIGEPIDVVAIYFEGATQLRVTRESTFHTSDPSIAFVDDEGNMIGLKRGQTLLTVTYNGLEATATVDVY